MLMPPSAIFIFIVIICLAILIIFIKKRLTTKNISKRLIVLCSILFCFSLAMLYFPVVLLSSWMLSQKSTKLTVVNLTPEVSSRNFLEIGYAENNKLYGVFWNKEKKLFFSEPVKNPPNNAIAAQEYNKIFFNESSSLLQFSLKNKVNKHNTEFFATPIYQTNQNGKLVPTYGARLTKKNDTKAPPREIIFTPPLTKKENFHLNEHLFSYTLVSSHTNNKNPQGIFFSGTKNGIFFDIFYAPYKGNLITFTSSKKQASQNYAPYYWNEASMLAFLTVHHQKTTNSTTNKTKDTKAQNKNTDKIFVTKIVLIKNPLSKENSSIMEIPIATSVNFLAENIKLQGDPSGRYLFFSELNEQPYIIVNEFIEPFDKKQTQPIQKEKNTLPPPALQSYPLLFPSLTSISSFTFSPTKKNTLAILGKSPSDPAPRVYMATMANETLRDIEYPLQDWILIAILSGLFFTTYLLSLLLITKPIKI